MSNPHLTDSEALRRLLASLPRLISFRESGPRWAVIKRGLGLGSTFATAFCRAHGLDPEEVIGPTDWEVAEDVFSPTVGLTDQDWEKLTGDPWPEDEPRYRRYPREGEP